MNQDKRNLLVKRMVDVLFVVDLVAALTMPWYLSGFLTHFGDPAELGIVQNASFPSYLLVLLPLMAASLLSDVILWELRKMMQTVLDGDCFVDNNVRSLHRMGILGIVISLILFVRCVLWMTLTAFAIGWVFLIAGNFSLVLEQVFAKAVQYKQENDLTI